MKKTPKISALFIIISALLITISCDKDKYNYNEPPASPFNGTITAIVENGKAYDTIVSKIVAGDWNEIWDRIDTIASGDYSSGSFTMMLPARLDDELLLNVNYWLGGLGLEISDKNADILFGIPFFAFNKNNQFVDFLYYCKVSETSYTDVEFVYADRDVIVTGSFKDYGFLISVGISLKKGWNKVYYTEYETEAIISTKAVGGMKWYFSKDLWASKNTPKRNTKLLRLNK
jgi:hypothetical protein